MGKVPIMNQETMSTKATNKKNSWYRHAQGARKLPVLWYN
jgi:hypothetical protein